MAGNKLFNAKLFDHAFDAFRYVDERGHREYDFEERIYEIRLLDNINTDEYFAELHQPVGMDEAVHILR